MNNLIQDLEKAIKNSKATLDVPDTKELHKWRKSRNLVIHSIAKSDPGTPTMSVEGVYKLAK